MAQQLFLQQYHEDNGARMVPFAGYMMPVQYAMGMLDEHHHTRQHAGLFDISHMGQVILRPNNNGMAPDVILEECVAAGIANLQMGKMRYTQLLHDNGGIVDDIMVTRDPKNGDNLYIVINGACKDKDINYLRNHIDGRCDIIWHDNTQLLALQGPKAASALQAVITDIDTNNMAFMTMQYANYNGHSIGVSRSGYSGEDGFELSLPESATLDIVTALLAIDDVALIGLGARDSLRLEAGLCLYGHELTDDITPIMADITFSVSKKRLETGGYKGHAVIARQYKEGAPMVRIGLLSEKRPIREGVRLVDDADNDIGYVTSGGYCATLGGPACLAYVNSDYDYHNKPIYFAVRNNKIAAIYSKFPFVKPNYKK